MAIFLASTVCVEYSTQTDEATDQLQTHKEKTQPGDAYISERSQDKNCEQVFPVKKVVDLRTTPGKITPLLRVYLMSTKAILLILVLFILT